MEVLSSNAKTPEQAFLQAARSALKKGLTKINHCLAQLSSEQVWLRPRDEMNSIANLLQHLCGNLRQWVISGAGGKPDVRNRPAEFTDRSGKSKEELLADFQSVLEECDQVLSNLDSRSLLEFRRIQGFDVQLLAAMFDTVSHFQGHVQEIIHMTRAMCGEKYQFYFVPRGKEQGAPEP